jgi:uncharacterized protein (UPF0335 family)
MDNIYVDMRNQGYTLSNYFKNKDMVSVEELLTKLEELIDDLENKEEELKDLKQDVEDNYRPLSQAEQIGYNEKDFYEV